MDHRYGKPTNNISKEKLLELLQKYPMPKPAGMENVNWAEDKAVFDSHVEHALNCYREEQEAKLEPKRRAEEQRRMEQRDQQAKQQRKRLALDNNKLRLRQLERFASGEGFRFTCGYCNVPLRPHHICTSRTCLAPSKINIEDLMSTLKETLRIPGVMELAREYYESKSKSKQSNLLKA
jgi:hypothetical protein